MLNEVKLLCSEKWRAQTKLAVKQLLHLYEVFRNWLPTDTAEDMNNEQIFYRNMEQKA